MTASTRAENTIRRSQFLVRISSVAFLAAALLYLVTGFLLLVAGGSSSTEGDAAWMVVLLTVLSLATGAFLLVAGVLGLRVARDYRHVVPYCVLSVVLAVLIGIEQYYSDFAVIDELMRGGIVGVLDLVFCLLAVVNAIAALSLAGYKKRRASDAKA